MKIKVPVLIVGLGKSGNAALRLLSLLGVSKNDIKTFDAKSPADFSSPDDLKTFKPQTIVVSPGVPLQSPWIQNLIRSGTELTSELALAADCLTTEKVIGITGSMGKSTTTTLLGKGANAVSTEVFVGGNLGTPLAEYACEVLEKKRTPAEWVILELSSYQLENAGQLKLNLGVLTALSPNHLERYASLDEYYQTKWQMKDRCQESFLLNYDNTEVARWCEDRLDSKCQKVFTKDYDLSLSKLIGQHNLQNLALAFSVARHFKWGSPAYDAMKSYTGLEHRLEFVAEKSGVKYINDSKATTIESVLAAVESCLPLLTSKESSLHVLIGGRDKNLPWESLFALQNESRIEAHFFGECGLIAKNRSSLSGSLSDNLKSLLNVFESKKGDVVLLSPGGSSLDEFKNFEERGDYFKNWVRTKAE